MTASLHTIAPEQIMAFLDGELSTIESHAVQAHLAECPECATLIEQLQDTTGTLSRWTVPSAPDRIEATVLEAISQPNPGGFRATRWNWKPWSIGLLAVSSLLVVLAVLPSRQNHKEFLAAATDANVSTASQTLRRAELAARSQAIAGLVNADKLSGQSEQAEYAPAPAAAKAKMLASRARTEAPLIARTVSLVVQVQEISASRIALDQILDRHHAYAAQLVVSSPESARHTLQASLRIPAPELAVALLELKALGRVENETQTGDEITQQHADLAARLKNSRDTEARLQAILRDRTGKLSDVLEVEQEIARVRADIETMQADLDALSHRVDFATVDLQLNQVYKAGLEAPDGATSTRLHNAFVAGYNNLTESILGLILFAIEYAPAILFWAVLLGLPALLLFRRYRRNRQR